MDVVNAENAITTCDEFADLFEINRVSFPDKLNIQFCQVYGV